MIILSVTIILLLAYLLLFLYYRKGWLSLPETNIENHEPTMISVLVPARNEEKNIGSLLEAIEGQSFPSQYFEVIVIDDFSTDRTASIVEASKDSNIRLIQPLSVPGSSSKKKAIEAGIKQARGSLIVTTDADCIPGRDWLSAIHSAYINNKASFIAAPVQFTHDSSLLQVFQATDFMMLQGITAASVATGFHTMCNGANLAYQKDAFLKVKGFEGIDNVASGDDMLLMYKIWKTDNSKVIYLKNRKAIVLSSPMKTWKEFFMQRKRWASKSLVYDDYRIIAVLALVYFFNIWFIVLIFYAIFQPVYWYYVLIFWIIKTLSELLLLSPVSLFYNERKLLRNFFFLQPLHIFYTVFVGMWSQAGKYEWKGRKTK